MYEHIRGLIRKGASAALVGVSASATLGSSSIAITSAVEAEFVASFRFSVASTPSHATDWNACQRDLQTKSAAATNRQSVYNLTLFEQF